MINQIRHVFAMLQLPVAAIICCVLWRTDHCAMAQPSPLPQVTVDTALTTQELEKRIANRWRDPKTHRSREALERFSQEFPNSLEAKLAVSRIFDGIVASRNREDLATFLEEHSHLQLRSEGAAALYQLTLSDAAALHDYESQASMLLEFVKRFPDCPEASLAIIEVEARLFAALVQLPTQGRCREFIESFPGSQLSGKVRELHLKWWLNEARKQIEGANSEGIEVIAADIANEGTNAMDRLHSSRADRPIADRIFDAMVARNCVELFKGTERADHQIKELQLTDGYKQVDRAIGTYALVESVNSLRDEVTASSARVEAALREGFAAVVKAQRDQAEELAKHFQDVRGDLGAMRADIRELGVELRQIRNQLITIHNDLQRIGWQLEMANVKLDAIGVKIDDLKNAFEAQQSSSGGGGWGFGAVEDFVTSTGVDDYLNRQIHNATAAKSSVLETRRELARRVSDAVQPAIECAEKAVGDTRKELGRGSRLVVSRLKVGVKELFSELEDVLRKAGLIPKGILQFEIRTRCSFAVNPTAGTYSATIHYNGGASTRIDEQSMRDASAGNWTWPDFDLTQAISDAFKQAATPGNDYDKVVRDHGAIAGEWRHLVASRDFVGWAGGETVVKHVATNILSAGSTARQTVVEVKQRLVAELEQLCAGLALEGELPDEKQFELLGSVVLEFAKAMAKKPDEKELFSVLPPDVDFGDFARLEWKFIDYWVDLDVGPAAIPVKPFKSFYSEFCKALERVGIHIPDTWVKQKVDLSPHLCFVVSLRSGRSSQAIRKLMERRDAAISDAVRSAVEQEIRSVAKTELLKQVSVLEQRLSQPSLNSSALLARACESAVSRCDNPLATQLLKLIKAEAEVSGRISGELRKRVEPLIRPIVDDVRSAIERGDDADLLVDLALSESRYTAGAVEGLLKKAAFGGGDAEVKRLVINLANGCIEGDVVIVSKVKW